jgi:hypothetical protein
MCAPRSKFLSRLGDLNLPSLDDDPNAVFALNADLSLAYVNPAWFRFAQENGGEPAISERFTIGTPVEAGIHGPLKPYYLARFQAALHSGVPWRQTYECSSTETFRLYHQTVYPLRNEGGLVIVNSLAVQEPMAAQARRGMEPDRRQYETPEGLIMQCSHCRCVQRVRQPWFWDWVPSWVARIPDGVSHALCDACHDRYYGRDPARAPSLAVLSD